jgi:hypothetical protein
MPGVEGTESEFRERLSAILTATPLLMQVLSVARHLSLPDWLVFSGAIYQPILNHLTGRPLDQSASGWNPTTGSKSKLPSVSPICSRCVCGPILAEGQSASPGPLRMCNAAGLKW